MAKLCVKPRMRRGLLLLVLVLGIFGQPVAEGGLCYAGHQLAYAAENPEPAPQQPQVTPPDLSPPSPLSHKQKKELLKSNIEKMKRDADELVALSKSLQEEVNGSNENVLSSKIVDTAEKIEKLAKRIRATASGR